MLQGSEPRELIREYYRLRRRARSLTSSADAAAASSGGDDHGPVREAFLGWYAARRDDVPDDAADAADTILQGSWYRGHIPGSVRATPAHRTGSRWRRT